MFGGCKKYLLDKGSNCGVSNDDGGEGGEGTKWNYMEIEPEDTVLPKYRQRLLER